MDFFPEWTKYQNVYFVVPDTHFKYDDKREMYWSEFVATATFV
jgi:hypothetical protein